MRHDIRNIAIIAHVDHGKTTLIDNLLKQSGTFRDNQQVADRVMDNNDLEKERGITILAKCTSLRWNDMRINVIDTPGHADFGGEVERVLSMADGVVLLVDAAEGPMPQTKFVLGKALAQGLRPMVVINKADRPDARMDEVLDEVFDLFVAMDASEEQLDFPVLYASGRDGWCVEHIGDTQTDLSPLFELVSRHVPAPDVDVDAPFSMLVTMLQADPYLGRTLTGLVYQGSAAVNMQVKSLNLDNQLIEQGRLSKLQAYNGITLEPIEKAKAGDIIVVAGLAKTSVADTICAPAVEKSLPSTPIDPPTMSISLAVNDSPLAGLDGKKLTSRMIRDRLMSEAETNVAITVTESSQKDTYEVGGRGELQLGVLIETMRREGFEVTVSRPKVIFQEDEAGNKTEPMEEVVIDVDDEYSGTVVESLQIRKGEMQDMRPSGAGKTRIVFYVPSRGLIGYQSQFLTDTRGTGVMNRLFHSYTPYKGDIEGRRNGSLISTGQGQAVSYAIFNLQDRGIMFINPQEAVYEGMVVGEHSRDNDLEINVLKGKQLTNVRASGTDENVRLSPPKKMTLEEMISYINDDELVEVTPSCLRLRKRFLCSNERKRAARSSA